MPNNPQTVEAVAIVDRLLPLVNEAERKLKSARNWGVLDLLGGGVIIDAVKHYKLGSARNIMDEVSALLQRLQQVLGSMEIPVDYRMRIGGFATFADFFFDGFLADAYMTSKIFSSLDQVRRLKARLQELRTYLAR